MMTASAPIPKKPRTSPGSSSSGDNVNTARPISNAPPSGFSFTSTSTDTLEGQVRQSGFSFTSTSTDGPEGQVKELQKV